MTNRPTWDETWLGVAKVMSQRAACTRRQVGALLVTSDKRELISVGYNGRPAGMRNCSDGGCPRGKLSYDEKPGLTSYAGNCDAIHAEVNAITRASEWQTRGAIMYVTCEPCEWCWDAIRQAGIAEIDVIFPERSTL